MKKIFFLVALATMCFQLKALSIETSTIDCSGNGAIETEAIYCGDNDYLIGLRFIQDSAGHHQYFLRLKIVGEFHLIHPNRKALIQFEKKSKTPIMELSASHQEFGDDVLHSDTYYPLTDTQLETLIRSNVIKIRFDTSDKLLDIFNCAMRLSNNLNKAKQEIT
ncbi:MAG: hypothetical protein J6W69_08940, partial [Bacteroidales bacterium]|nr:hypothetical protein [Bacteroidales bacterium]